MSRVDLNVEGTGDATVEAWDGALGTRIVHQSRHVFYAETSPLLGKLRPCFVLGQIVDTPLAEFIASASAFDCVLAVDREKAVLRARSGPYDASIQVQLRPFLALDAVDIRGSTSGRMLEQYRWTTPQEIVPGVVIPTVCEFILYRDLGPEPTWLQRMTLSLSAIEVNVPIVAAHFRPDAPEGYVQYDHRTLRLTETPVEAPRDVVDADEQAQVTEVGGEPAREPGQPATPVGTARRGGIPWRQLSWIGIGIVLVALACMGAYRKMNR